MDEIKEVMGPINGRKMISILIPNSKHNVAYITAFCPSTSLKGYQAIHITDLLLNSQFYILHLKKLHIKVSQFASVSHCLVLCIIAKIIISG